MTNQNMPATRAGNTRSNRASAATPRPRTRLLRSAGSPHVDPSVADLFQPLSLALEEFSRVSVARNHHTR